MRKHLLNVFVIFIVMFGLAGMVKETRSVDSVDPYAKSNAVTGSNIKKAHEITQVDTSLRKAPAFTLKNLQGARVSLSDFRGKKVLLNMWASWCGPCRQEMPELVKIDQAFPDDQLAVIGVNMTSEELSMKDVRSFVKQYDVNYPILLDSQGEVMKKYRIIGVPTTFLINEKGGIVHEFRGIVTMEKVKKYLQGGGGLP